MPIGSVEAMNASLANDYGATRGPHAADVLEVVLFYDDPGEEADPFDVEIDEPGYARVELDQDTGWAAPADGAITTWTPVQFPAATDEWVLEPRFWGLVDQATGALWDYDELPEQLIVREAGLFRAVSITVYHPDNEEPAA